MKVNRQLVCVVGIVIRDGKILALRRAKDKDAAPGIWETVSGRVRLGEDPLDAVRREIEEETGLSISVEPRPVDVYTASRANVPMVVIVYRALYLSGEVSISVEHDDYSWVTHDGFVELTSLDRLVVAVERAMVLPILEEE